MIRKIRNLIICFLLIILTGCANKESKDNLELRHCHVDYDNVVLDIDAKNDIISKISVNFIYHEESLDFDIYKANQKELNKIKETAFAQLGINEENEGVTINVSKAKNNINMKIDIDVLKTDSKVLNKFGITGNTRNVKLSETINTIEESNDKIKLVCE